MENLNKVRVPKLEDYRDLLSTIDDFDSGETFGVLKTQTMLLVTDVVLRNWLSCTEVTVQ